MDSGNHTEADCVCVRVCIAGASLRGAHRRKQSRPGEQPARGGKPPPPPVHQGAPLMVTHAQQNRHLQCVASMLVWIVCPITDKKRVTFLDHPQHWCVSHQEGVKVVGTFLHYFLLLLPLVRVCVHKISIIKLVCALVDARQSFVSD